MDMIFIIYFFYGYQRSSNELTAYEIKQVIVFSCLVLLTSTKLYVSNLFRLVILAVYQSYQRKSDKDNRS